MSQAATKSEAQVTTSHDEIRKWVEQRQGVPASVKDTAKGGEPGVLRIDFEPRDAELEPISWEEFFKKFEKEKLAFLHQDKTADGSLSRSTSSSTARERSRAERASGGEGQRRSHIRSGLRGLSAGARGWEARDSTRLWMWTQSDIGTKHSDHG
jgi:hypothetical protein